MSQADLTLSELIDPADPPVEAKHPTVAGSSAYDPTKIKESHVISGMGRSMLACEFDPTGSSLVAGGMLPDLVQYKFVVDNGQIQWDQAGERLHVVAHKSWVGSVCFSQSGDRLYSAGYAGDIFAWEYPLRDASQLPLWSQPTAHRGWIRALDISPDGQTLASCGNDHSVRLWSASDGQLIRELEGHACHVYSTAFHPRGDRLYSGDLEGHLMEWELSSGRMIREKHAQVFWVQRDNLQLGGIRTLIVHPDGDLIALGGMYGFGSIGDGIGAPCAMFVDEQSFESTKILTQNESHRSFVNGIHFLTPEVTIGVTGGLDSGMILSWKPDEVVAAADKKPDEIPTGKAYDHHKIAASGWGSSMHPDHRHLAVAHHDQTVRVYDLFAQA